VGVSPWVRRSFKRGNHAHSPILPTQFRPRHGRRGRRAAVAGARLYAADGAGARKKILVAIFQRGAADGLNVVVPHGEKAYYDLRPTIAIPRPTSDRERRTTPPSTWTASSACTPRSRRSSRCSTSGIWRSSMRWARPTRRARTSTRRTTWNRARPAGRPRRSGWMNRALPPRRAGKVSPVRAVSLGRCCRTPCAAARRRSRCRASRASRCATRRPPGSSSRCTRRRRTPAAGAGRETFEAVAMLQAIQKQPIHARRRRRISARPLRRQPAADRAIDQERCGRGDGVRRYRRLGPPRQRTGPRPSEGVLANLLREYGQALSAFWKDMGDRMNDVVVVTMSEFGRTARERQSRHRSRARQQHVRDGRRRQRRQGLRQVARAWKRSSSTKAATWR
jgi:hypothetical protein